MFTLSFISIGSAGQVPYHGTTQTHTDTHTHMHTHTHTHTHRDFHYGSPIPLSHLYSLDRIDLWHVLTLLSFLTFPSVTERERGAFVAQ